MFCLKLKQLTLKKKEATEATGSPQKKQSKASDMMALLMKARKATEFDAPLSSPAAASVKSKTKANSDELAFQLVVIRMGPSDVIAISTVYVNTFVIRQYLEARTPHKCPNATEVTGSPQKKQSKASDMMALLMKARKTTESDAPRSSPVAASGGSKTKANSNDQLLLAEMVLRAQV